MFSAARIQLRRLSFAARPSPGHPPRTTRIPELHSSRPDRLKREKREEQYAFARKGSKVRVQRGEVIDTATLRDFEAPLTREELLRVKGSKEETKTCLGEMSIPESLYQGDTLWRLPLSEKVKKEERALAKSIFKPNQAKRLIKSTLSYAELTTQLAEPVVPEIAFIGRGNVGKSTMMSALTLCKKIVQASKDPGHTRGLAVVDVDRRLRLVDTPGYGHASSPKWGEAIIEYFQRRRHTDGKRLKRVILLIDIRRGLMDVDKDAIAIMEDIAVPYQAVLTKMDMMTRTAARVQKALVEDWLARNTKHCASPLVVLSARTGEGIEDLRAHCLRACNITQL